MIAQLVRMSAITILILLCTFLPFIPGEYDAFAVTLSGMSQLFGVAGLMLVPVGALWGFGVWRMMRRVRLLRNSEIRRFNPAPLYRATKADSLVELRNERCGCAPM